MLMEERLTELIFPIVGQALVSLHIPLGIVEAAGLHELRLVHFILK